MASVSTAIVALRCLHILVAIGIAAEATVLAVVKTTAPIAGTVTIMAVVAIRFRAIIEDFGLGGDLSLDGGFGRGSGRLKKSLHVESGHCRGESWRCLRLKKN